MNKILPTALLLIALCGSIYAKDADPAFTIALDGSYTTYDKYKPISAYGLDMQFFFSRYFSLNSKWVFGPHFAHMPLMAYLFRNQSSVSSSNSDNDVWKIILIFEGCAVHFWLVPIAAISVYANPLGYEYIGRDRFKSSRLSETDPRWVVSGAFGVKFSLYFENIVIAPYAEYKRAYATHATGYGGGLGIGFHL